MPPLLSTDSEPLRFERRQSICRRVSPAAGSVLGYRGRAEGDGVRATKKLRWYSCKKRIGDHDTNLVLEPLATGKLLQSEAQSN
jgi:hypothetical protein